MSKEHKLQAQIVMSHSQERPEDYGLLWATLNRTLSPADGMKQKAQGLIAGVPDLLYYKNEKLIGFEIKFPGESHKKEHIVKQLNWGKSIYREGGEYYIIKSVQGFWAVLYGEKHKDVFNIERIEEKIAGKSTIVF